MSEIIAPNFDDAYLTLLQLLNSEGQESTNRKGDKLTELFDQKFMILNPLDCFAYSRQPSLDYLKKEFAFYLSGSDKLEDAVKCSKFWEKCSDDGKTINSNYGKLLFHDKNEKGITQFQHAVNCLDNNLASKKAVMTIYSKENAYISNDNPCTMFLQARIEKGRTLHMTVHMRSSDIYFGLPYDVPFFVFVQQALLSTLQELHPLLQLGTYTHIAGSLHKYARNEEALDACFAHKPFIREVDAFNDAYQRLSLDGIAKVQAINCKPITEVKFMQRAWGVSTNAKCLKKKVGACMTIVRDDGTEKEICSFYGGKDGSACTECVRDVNSIVQTQCAPSEQHHYDPYYGDECPSVHSEMRCITHAMRGGLRDFSKVRIYVTHGPCDACLKFANHVGIKEVFYDVPYKTDYSHWPNINVIQICVKSPLKF